MAKIKVDSLLKYIPDEEINKIEEETKINFQVKKMTWITMFKLLLMWMLKEWKNSLRTNSEIT